LIQSDTDSGVASYDQIAAYKTAQVDAQFGVFNLMPVPRDFSNTTSVQQYAASGMPPQPLRREMGFGSEGVSKQLKPAPLIGERPKLVIAAEGLTGTAISANVKIVDITVYLVLNRGTPPI